MRLCLGGAPAGPAGTGKTETTKDLGRALGIMVYVFNCSDQMDYRSMGQIFKGLSQAGAWGCFDEFNRIDISVLSVVSTQWKCILDAIRAKKPRFVFEDEDIMLCHSPFCSAYITMNPGYAGRTELPESVKALFRPCAMIVPDMDLICEIMLMSEGYSNGKVLARKFMILYRLSESLLSAQKHYDWKLRSVRARMNVCRHMQTYIQTSARVYLYRMCMYTLSFIIHCLSVFCLLSSTMAKNSDVHMCVCLYICPCLKPRTYKMRFRCMRSRIKVRNIGMRVCMCVHIQAHIYSWS
jgi:hypothetical protein